MSSTQSPAPQPNQQKVTTNILWKFSGLGFKLLTQLAAVAVLSRLLPIEAFGVITYAMIFVNFTELLMQLGVGPAVIQNQNATTLTIRVAFTLSVMAGVLGTLLLFAIAPLLASSSSDIPVFRTLAGFFLLSSFGAIADALLQKQGRFKNIAIIESTSYFLGYALLTIILAFAGFGVYSLIFGVLAQVGIRSLFLLLTVRHSLIPSFARAEMRGIFRFGAGLTAARMFNFLALNGDYFLVGRLIGERALGLYSRAFYIMRLPTDLLTTALHAVLFPSFAEIQNDRKKLCAAWLGAVRMSATFVLPLMALLAVIAPELVPVFLGKGWEESVVPLQILTPIGFLNLYTLSDALLKAAGEIKRQMIGHALFAAALLTAVFIGSQNGLQGVAIGVVAANILMFVYMTARSLQILPAGVGDFFRQLRAGVVLGFVTAGAGLGARYFLTRFIASEILVLSGTVLVAILAALLAFQAPTEIFREIRQPAIRLLRSIFSKNKAA